MAKPGVHQQLEFEYGGPLTPSPAPSPIKKSHQNAPSSLHSESPAIRASDALNASIRESSTDVRSIPLLDQQQLPPVVSSGFTPVNAGGFTPVNAAPATFAPVNVNNNNHRLERDSERGFTPPRRTIESPMSSSKNTPEYRPSALGSTPLTNGYTSNPLKRQLSHDSLDSRNKENHTPGTEGEKEKEGRRSKRLKKGMLRDLLWAAHSAFPADGVALS